MRRFSPSITHAIEPASIVDITPGYAHVKALTTYSQTNETAMNRAPKPLPGNTRRSARPHKVLWGALALALVWIPLMAVAQIEESNSDEYTDLSNQDSFIWGNAGDDVIDSGGGGDWINGNAGNVVISGGGFGNFLFGGIGNDDLDGGLGSDFLFGGSGDDVLIGSAGDDILQGDSKEYARPILPGWQVTYDNNSGSSSYGNVVVTVDGTDYDSDGMIMYHQAVSIFQAEILITAANPGNDTLAGGPGDDDLYGGPGQDTADYRDAASGIVVSLYRGTASDDGDDGRDTLTDIENVDGSNHADHIIGDRGANELRGDNGYDTIEGKGGNVLIYGNHGHDTLIGNNGKDEIYGGIHNDTLQGRNGDDSLDGGNGRDILEGGDGKDTLLGGKNDDILEGGLKDDTLTGGDGVDTFVLNSGNGHDTITDYQAGEVIEFMSMSMLVSIQVINGSTIISAGDVSVRLAGYTGQVTYEIY